jgi:glycosyltransferase involved in cell wall biosynthesis
VRRHVMADPPDVLVAVDSFLVPFTFPALLGTRVRRVAWEHFNLGTNLNMRSRALARPIAALISHDVLTLTLDDAGAWRAAFPWARARLHAMPNSLPTPRPIRNPYSVDGASRRLVIAAGRLDGQKGFDRLLDAWALIEQDVPDWTLAVYGHGPDEDTLRAQMQRLGVQRVALHPPTANIHGVYAQAGAYALSSRHEGLPMVLIESQAQGIPAVAFDCRTGPAEIIRGGGHLVPDGDVPAFASTLRTLLRDDATRAAMSDAAFEDAARYDAPLVLNRWAALLEGR